MKQPFVWPDGKEFAFTIFDDTDRATVNNVGLVYSFLTELGFRTTKSVWPFQAKDAPLDAGSTCEDQQYLTWLRRLQADGFEIGYHNARCKSTLREDTIRGLERFAELFGHYPKSMAHHVGCQENLYWGINRVSGYHRVIYNLLTRNRRNGKYQGHLRETKFFWGDISKEKIKYTRNFVFPEINTLQMCPVMPYHDPARPYVNYWFASSGGSTVSDFIKCISEENQDRLEAQGGACIMYAHFAFGFCQDGKLNDRFKFLMERLRKKNGWFVPVSVLLDYMLSTKDDNVIMDIERRRLERAWLSRKIWVGTR